MGRAHGERLRIELERNEKLAKLHDKINRKQWYWIDLWNFDRVNILLNWERMRPHPLVERNVPSYLKNGGYINTCYDFSRE